MLFAFVAETALPTWFVLVYSAIIGVGIDFDHFLVARVNTGSWHAARDCLRNPTRVFAGQDEIFEDGEVGTLRRLLSHVVIVGLLIPVLAVVSLPLALLTAVVLYGHLLSDLIWDVYLEIKNGSPEVPNVVRRS
ncbi:hypothetical protein AUR64_05535 [Haloprofundus marisrubri]|uniref:Membrane-bound metal-dependent hydrolase n=1 Tax=Haloprofundus marisrubri TaxID=1514971 RepID=A0A0W1RCP4_9EURY|nr:hypothetical protein [Haloprofundus marisrubri]KTG11170.1 hypothetical protein AUR64_05535 [Haloprofundus marisrubri]